MARFRAAAAAIAGDSRGTSVLELALAAPVLMLLVIGIADLGRGLSASFALNQSLQRTLEKAVVSNRRSDFAYLRTEAAAAAGVPQSNVTVDAWLECDGTKKASFDDSCAAGQQVTRYVEITIDSSFVPSFSYSYRWFGGVPQGGAIPLQSKAAVRIQ